MRMKDNLWCEFLVCRYINVWIYKGSHNVANILVFEIVFYIVDIYTKNTIINKVMLYYYYKAVQKLQKRLKVY